MPMTAAANEKALNDILKSRRKELDTLAKDCKASAGVAKSVEQNSGAQIRFVSQLAIEVGRAVQDARDMGAKGTRFADFSQVPGVETAAKEFASFEKGACAGTASVIKAELKNITVLESSANGIYKACGKEITDQESFAKSMKSPLPKGVKDLKEMQDEAKNLNSTLTDVKSDLVNLGDYADEIRSKWEKGLATEFGKTKANRDMEEQMEMLEHSLNARKLGQVRVEISGMAKEVDGVLTMAELAVLAEDAKAIDSQKAEAKAIMPKLMKIKMGVESKVKSLSGFALKSYKGSPAEREVEKIDGIAAEAQKVFKKLMGLTV